MLERLNPHFHVTTRLPPSSSGTLRLRRRFGSLAPDLEELYAEVGEVEVLGPDPKYFRIWSPEGSIDMDDGYKISEHIPGAVPIGDDGGGHVILFMSNGIHRTSYGALFPEDLVFLAKSLGDFLADPEPLWPANEL